MQVRVCTQTSSRFWSFWFLIAAHFAIPYCSFYFKFTVLNVFWERRKFKVPERRKFKVADTAAHWAAMRYFRCHLRGQLGGDEIFSLSFT